MKPRVTTTAQDQANAAWFEDLRKLGNVRSRARALGISVPALYDSIARGKEQPTHNEKAKLATYLREMSAKLREPAREPEMVSHEALHSESIDSTDQTTRARTA